MSVEERLAALEAAEAARGILARYAQACDKQDLAALGELFAEDSVLEAGKAYEGRSAILDFYRSAFASDPTRKAHFVSNVVVEWLGDDTVAVGAVFLFTAAGEDASIIGWGTYRDTVRVDEGTALFTRKSIAMRRSVDVREGWALAPAGPPV